MELIEDNSKSNDDKIISRIGEAVSRAITGINAIDAQQNIDSVLLIYIDLLKLLNSFKTTPLQNVDYLTPLNGLMSLETNAGQKSQLVCIVSVALLHGLANPSTFNGTCDFLCLNKTKHQMTDMLSSFEVVSDHTSLHLYNVDNIIDLITAANKELVKSCVILLKVFSEFDSLMKLLTDFTSAGSNDDLFITLETVVNNLMNEDTCDVTTMLLFNSNFISSIGQIRTKSESVMSYTKIIKHLVIDRLIYSFHFPLIKEKIPYLFHNCSMKFPSVNASSQNVIRSFKFILSCLNHGDALDEGHKLSLVYCHWSLDQIRNYTQLVFGRSNIHAMYHELYPKYSLFTTIKILTQRLIQEYFRAELIEWPGFLNKCSPKLPPLPKEDYLSDTFENKCPIDMELVDDNYSKLVLINITKCLGILSMFALDELQVYSSPSNGLETKILIRKFDGIFEVLALCGVVVNERSNSLVKASSGQKLIETFASLLGGQTTDTQPFLLWLEFIQLCNKYVINDLRFLPVFHFIIDGLLLHFRDTSILNDQLIRNEIVGFFLKMSFDGVKYEEIARYTGIRHDTSTVRVTKEDLGSVYDLILTHTEEEEDTASANETVSTELSNLSLRSYADVLAHGNKGNATNSSNTSTNTNTNTNTNTGSNTPNSNTSTNMNNSNSYNKSYYHQQYTNQTKNPNQNQNQNQNQGTYSSPQYRTPPMQQSTPNDYSQMLGSHNITPNYPNYNAPSSNASTMSSRYGSTNSRHTSVSYDKYNK